MDDNHPGTPSHGHSLWVPGPGPGMQRLGGNSRFKGPEEDWPARRQQEKTVLHLSFRLGNPQPGKSLPISRPINRTEKGNHPSPAGLKGQW